MNDDTLLGIGSFSVLSGLSISTLRHYDEVQLLAPVKVDLSSGYRRYAVAQVPTARLIRALRAVDLSLADIRGVLAAPDEAVVTDLLTRHRRELASRHDALTAQLAQLDSYIDKGIAMSKTTGSRVVEVNLHVLDADTAARFYEEVFEVEFSRDQHGDGLTHLMAVFGSWPSDEFFLLNIATASDGDEAGTANFGFLVDDLDAAHARALAAGGAERSAPAEVAGMPRFSSVRDPAGNVVNLYQNA